jgi:hypothetical protein
MGFRMRVARQTGRYGSNGLVWEWVGSEEFRGEGCGIPHLANNGRDMGHPAFVCREEDLECGVRCIDGGRLNRLSLYR